MLERLRNQIGTAGLVVAIVALVAALGGGAYAATGGGKATASAKAKQGPRGKTGKTGPAGPQGAPGSNGKDGTNGTNGTNGANGTPGADGKSVTQKPLSSAACGNNGSGGVEYSLNGTGTKVCNGKNGALQPEETLCNECSETGVWGYAAVEEPAFGFSVSYSPISFEIPLEVALPEANVHKTGDAGFATDCPGSPEEPKAEPGHLCVYVAATQGEIALEHIIKPGTASDAAGAGTSGAILELANQKLLPGSIRGTWAVTAE